MKTNPFHSALAPLLKCKKCTRKLIIAGNYNQYYNYCKENGLPNDTPMVKYIYDAKGLRGLRGCEVIFVGNYTINPAHNDPYLKYVVEDCKVADPKTGLCRKCELQEMIR